MQQHTYAFAEKWSRKIINLSHSEKPEENPDEIVDTQRESGIADIWQRVTTAIQRIRAIDGEDEKTIEEEKKLALPNFYPVDFDDMSERDAAIRHFIGLAQQFPELTEVVYIAHSRYLNLGKIRFNLELELQKVAMNFKGEIEEIDVDMEVGPDIDLREISAVAITIQRPNV